MLLKQHIKENRSLFFSERPFFTQMTSALVVLCTFLVVACSARNRWVSALIWLGVERQFQNFGLHVHTVLSTLLHERFQAKHARDNLIEWKTTGAKNVSLLQGSTERVLHLINNMFNKWISGYKNYLFISEYVLRNNARRSRFRWRSWCEEFWEITELLVIYWHLEKRFTANLNEEFWNQCCMTCFQKPRKTVIWA